MSQTFFNKIKYNALSPLVSLAGIFISPIASTLPPLIFYFIFRNRHPVAADNSLKTADLAFSVQLWIILASLAVGLGNSMDMLNFHEARSFMDMATKGILLAFIVSLLYAIYQIANSKPFKFIISFKIAERVTKMLDKKNKSA